MTLDEKTDEIRLNHILEASDRIAQFMDSVSKTDFEKNVEKQSAVILQLEIIGEAANGLSAKFVSAYPEIEWRDVVNMRNELPCCKQQGILACDSASTSLAVSPQKAAGY